MTTLIEKIRELVASGDTEKSLEELLSYVKVNKNEVLDRIVLLKSRMHELNESILKGTIDDKEAAIERARINESILRILHEITPSYLEAKEEKHTPSMAYGAPTAAATGTTWETVNKKNFFIGLAFLIFVVAFFVYLFNDDNPQTTTTSTQVTRPKAADISTIDIGIPTVEHNLLINNVYFLKIKTPGSVKGAQGKKFQLVGRFRFNGKPLMANANESYYRAPDGTVGVATNAILLPSDNYSFDHEELLIPYYAFNFTNSGGKTPYNVFYNVEVYVDDRLQKSSIPQYFTVNW